MPAELLFGIPRYSSSDLKDNIYVQHPLDYSKDANVNLYRFNSTNHPFLWNGTTQPWIDDMFDKQVYVNPQLPINHTLSAFNRETEEQFSRYACAYEDPGGVQERGYSSPPRAPQCAQEHSRRLQLIDELTYNDYTPLVRNTPSGLLSPIVVGLRIIAHINGPGGMNIGYKFSPVHGKCRPGSFAPIQNFLASSTNENVQCKPCEKGTFTPSDSSTYCFECPKGTYANVTGQSRCWPCPMGYSTVRRGSSEESHCRPYCRAGSFSSTGLEPCQLCPIHTTQDKVGAIYCDPCKSNSITTGQTGEGFTNVAPWRCMDTTNFQFFIERETIFGQKLSIVVTWRIPDAEVHVNDLVVLFKGDGWTSLRQLQWAYASAAAINGETVCSGWLSDICRQPGTTIKPWASVLFNVDISGPGIYSAIYFSYLKEFRMLKANWTCSAPGLLWVSTGPTDGEELESQPLANALLKNKFEFTQTEFNSFNVRIKNSNAVPLLTSASYIKIEDKFFKLDLNSFEQCTFDSGQWEKNTGLYVCAPGQFSESPTHIGNGPCLPCPPGTFSASYASPDCTSCGLVSCISFCSRAFTYQHPCCHTCMIA